MPEPEPGMALPPVSLYVHVPWCVRKCPYCDFNSHAAPDELPHRRYVDSLLRDFEAEIELLQGRAVQSIFFGGGTPSLLDPEQAKRLVDELASLADISTDAEITLEANPGTIDQSRFHRLREAGINRLSIGIQSFNDAALKQLGRIHDSKQAHTAYEVARDAGFTNINLDLMHGLPGQASEDALSDLEAAIALKPEHLSWYQLTIEPNTEFFSRPPALPTELTLERIEERGLSRLSGAGFRRYEISAFASPGKEAQHNLNYWKFGDYLGIGAGAHGKITLPESGKILRTTKTRLPEDYLKATFPQDRLRHYVAPEERVLEFMMNWLRLDTPLDLGIFTARTGLPGEKLQPGIRAAIQQKLLDPELLSPTELGRRFLNQLLGLFQA